MSNWSLVIVNWSSIDDAAKKAGHRARWEAIVDLYQKAHGRRGGWQFIAPCSDDESLGGACEVAIVGHVNHFQPESMLELLRGVEWEYPGEVCLAWKDEDMEYLKVERMDSNGATTT